MATLNEIIAQERIDFPAALVTRDTNLATISANYTQLKTMTDQTAIDALKATIATLQASTQDLIDNFINNRLSVYQRILKLKMITDFHALEQQALTDDSYYAGWANETLNPTILPSIKTVL